MLSLLSFVVSSHLPSAATAAGEAVPFNSNLHRTKRSRVTTRVMTVAASASASCSSYDVAVDRTPRGFSRPSISLTTVLLLLLLPSCAGVAVVVLHRLPSSDFGTTGDIIEESILIRFQRHNIRRPRKLLALDSCSSFKAEVNESSSLGDIGNKEVMPSRAWGENRCSESDIVIDQGPSSPLPNGIPTYSVAILNACSTGCDIGGIHLKCGKFSTARLINPDIFKRLDYDDCLVYGGRPIPNGMTLSFEYANTYPYPMDIIKYECCPTPL